MAIELPAPCLGECPFCRALEQEEFHIAVSPGSVCFVPDRADTEGALLVVSRRHVATLLELSAAESLDLIELGKRAALALAAEYDIDAFNFWWDTGVLAGQRYLHVAIEILPRHENDGHKFMPLDERPLLAVERRREIGGRIRLAIGDAHLQEVAA